VLPPRSGRVGRASKHHRRRLQTCAWDAWQHGQAKEKSRGAIWAHASMHHHAVAIRPGRAVPPGSTCRRLQLTRSHSSVPSSRRHPLPRWSGQVLRPQDQHGRRPRSRAERRTAPTSRREVRIFLPRQFRKRRDVSGQYKTNKTNQPVRFTTSSGIIAYFCL